jgi:hypothetical protein
VPDLETAQGGATCPASYDILGGGVVDGNNHDGIDVLGSWPTRVSNDDPNGTNAAWEVAVQNNGRYTPTQSVSIYAICAFLNG